MSKVELLLFVTNSLKLEWVGVGGVLQYEIQPRSQGLFPGLGAGKDPGTRLYEIDRCSPLKNLHP